VTGTLSNMQATTTAGGSGTTPWNNVSLSGNLTRSSAVSMAGATSTSGPPAGAGTAGFSAAATGSFSASFYGPSAQEVGGTWTLYESTVAGGKSAVGTFAGR
ncbi:MAG TPA: transferrin-binding protein-like solute binding protein, partial [Rhizomicrobium sp.]|nr:transferrin-binding protein-like solute binding protein [Rhizomicrobium sp.]